MANRTDSRRLDELVKQTLSNYESATPVSDWQKMESMLGTAPKVSGSAFKFPSFSVSGEGAGFVKSIFSSYIFIVVLMLAGGGYLLYTILKAPKQDTAVTTELPVDTVASTPTVAPVVIQDTVQAQNTSAPAIKPEIIKDTVAAVTTETVKEKTEEEVRAEKKEAKDKKEAELTEKKEKEKKEKIEAEKLKEKKREEKREEARKAEKKEKERIAKEEKEKNAEPKETLKKSNNPVGLNFLRSVNLDSLKKQQEQPAPQPQQPKDSVKTQ